jgi:hypothetical protein
VFKVKQLLWVFRIKKFYFGCSGCNNNSKQKDLKNKKTKNNFFVSGKSLEKFFNFA